MRLLPAFLLALTLFLVACEPVEETASAPENSTSEIVSEEIATPPLWTEADGERTFVCITGEGFQELHITLPPSSPHTEELNALNSQVHGRAPLDVIRTVYFQHGKILKDLDETDWLQSITLDTPEGERILDARDNRLGFYLYDQVGRGSRAGDEAERRMWELRDRVRDESSDGVEYFITERPLTQVNSITVKWGASANCVPQGSDQ